jgi:hypothetical protein
MAGHPRSIARQIAGKEKEQGKGRKMLAICILVSFFCCILLRLGEDTEEHQRKNNMNKPESHELFVLKEGEKKYHCCLPSRDPGH